MKSCFHGLYSKRKEPLDERNRWEITPTPPPQRAVLSLGRGD